MDRGLVHTNPARDLSRVRKLERPLAKSAPLLELILEKSPEP
jgi:hypothetical protein